MRPIKTALVHNIVTPYRNVLFNSLSDHPDINLHVFYCAKSHEKRNWTIADNLSHNHTFLPGFKFDRSDLHFHVNPRIVQEIVCRNFETTVIGGCTGLTMQLGYIASKLTGTGTVLWTERIRPPRGKAGQIVSPVIRRVTSHADSVVVPTTAARRFQEAKGIEREKLFISPNVINNGQFYTTENSSDLVQLLFVGQLIERKGISYLLKAYEAVDDPGIELVIVGDGTKRDEYEKKARSRNLNVTFTGWVSEEEKIKQYANADLFILPSLEDLAPLVINEALASGLPVLTTQAVGNAEDMIVEGCNGHIVTTGDANALAESISDLLSDPDELRVMGKRSRRIVEERFSPTFAVNRFADAIKAAVTD